MDDWLAVSRGFKKHCFQLAAMLFLCQPEQKKIRQQINILDFRGQYRHFSVFKFSNNISANSPLIT